MCGRVVSNLRSEALARVSRARRMDNEQRYVRSHNIPPTGYLPVIINCNCTETDCNGVRLEAVKWGSFENNDNPNARTETIPFSKNYLNIIDNNNFCCIIIDGYFEWRNLSHNKEKEPFYIKPTPYSDGDDNCFVLAGIFEEGIVAGVLEKRCIILTQDSCSYLSEIHDRMPVFLKKNEISLWLSQKDRKEFMGLLSQIKLQNKKICDQEITFYQVSNMVSKPKNTSELLILPKKDAPCDKNLNFTLSGFFNSVSSRKNNDNASTQASDLKLNFKSTSFNLNDIESKFKDSKEFELIISTRSTKPDSIVQNKIISSCNKFITTKDSQVEQANTTQNKCDKIENDTEISIFKSEIDFLFDHTKDSSLPRKSIRKSEVQTKKFSEEPRTADNSIREEPEKVNKNAKKKKKNSLESTKEKMFMNNFLQKATK